MKNIKTRVTISFLSNCFRGASILLTGILLARFFGAEDYGRFVFAIAIAMAIKQFLDLGISSAFFTFLSQESKSAKFLAKFLLFFFSKYIIFISLMVFAIPGSIFSKLFLDNSVLLIVVAIIATVLQFDFWPITAQLLESQRKTIKVQVIFIITQLIQFIFIITTHLVGILNIMNYLIFSGIIWFIAGLVAINLYESNKNFNEDNVNKVTLKKYFEYCLPIAPILLLTVIGEFLDKWMLQKWGGETQQAFFAVSAQIASGTLLITASFIKIFWKEVAEAWHYGEAQSAIKAYLGARQFIFYCGALIAAATIPWAENIIKLLYGNIYLGCASTLIIMMLYSLHQSMGQIDSAFLMATSNTKIGFKVNILLAPIGLLISFILLSTSEISWIGMDMGANGLAIKMIICQIISVNFIAYIIQKKMSINFNLYDQIKIPLLLMALSFFIKFCLINIIGNNKFIFFISTILYVTLIVILAFLNPKLILLPSGWMEKISNQIKLK